MHKMVLLAKALHRKVLVFHAVVCLKDGNAILQNENTWNETETDEKML